MKTRCAVIVMLLAVLYAVCALIADVYIQREITARLTALAAESSIVVIKNVYNPDLKNVMKNLLEELPDKTARIKKDVIDKSKPYSWLLIFPDDPETAAFWERIYIDWTYYKKHRDITRKKKSLDDINLCDRRNFDFKPLMDMIARTISENYDMDIRFDVSVISHASPGVVKMGDAIALLFRITANAGPQDDIAGRAVVEYAHWIDTDCNNNTGKMTIEKTDK